MLRKRFGLTVLGLRPFLPLRQGLLRSEGRLRRRLGLELVSQRAQLSDGLFRGGGIGRGLGLEWGLCRSRTLVLYNQCTRSFSIIDGRWL